MDISKSATWISIENIRHIHNDFIYGIHLISLDLHSSTCSKWSMSISDIVILVDGMARDTDVDQNRRCIEHVVWGNAWEGWISNLTVGDDGESYCCVRVCGCWLIVRSWGWWWHRPSFRFTCTHHALFHCLKNLKRGVARSRVDNEIDWWLDFITR